MTDTPIQQLIINQLTKEQYEALTPEDFQLYLTPDTTDQDIASAINIHNISNSAHANIMVNKLDVAPDGTNNLITNNKITDTYLPDYIFGQMLYAGNFDPTITTATLTPNAKVKLGTTANTIALTNDTSPITGYEANSGCYYICTADGTFAGISLLTGDWLVSIGTEWQKIDNTDAVTGVKGNAESTYRLGNVNITIDNVAPTQIGNSGKYLTTDGTNCSWGTVDALPSQSGQSGKFLTTNGTSASWANVDALPSQTGQSGKFLTTNGVSASWNNPPVTDVQSNGTSVVTNGIANIPKAGIFRDWA